MATLVDVDSVTVEAELVIVDALDVIAAQRPGGTLRSWYHDMPIWIYRVDNQALQMALYLERGVRTMQVTYVPSVTTQSAPVHTRFLRLPFDSLTSDQLAREASALWDDVGR